MTGHRVILGRPSNRAPSRSWALTLRGSWDLAEGGDEVLRWSGEDDFLQVLNKKNYTDNRGP